MRGALRIMGMCAAAAIFASAAANEPAFLTDLQKLTASPHRMAGTPEGKAAAAYLEARLRGMGIKDVLVLDMPVVHPEIVTCQLTVDSTTVELTPLLPNLILSPVTPSGGFYAPLRYVPGDLSRSDSLSSVENAIAVIDYDCDMSWRQLFMMGARAVIFLGDSVSTPWYPKSVAAAVNLLRFYAPPEAQRKINLRTSHEKAHLVSALPWRRSVGRNLVALIPGKNPAFASASGQPEMVVLTAHYDSYGEAPFNAPGARSAANVAAILEAAESFAAHPLNRDILIVLTDNEAQFHQGAYAVYDALTRKEDYAQAIEREHRREHAYVRNFLDSLVQVASKTVSAPEIIRRLMNTAENIRNDVKQELARVRFLVSEKPNDASLVRRRDSLTADVQRWDDALFALSSNTTAGIAAAQMRQLLSSTERELRQRLDELDLLIKIDEQEKVLRTRCGGRRIALVVSYNFSDGGHWWGPVVGDGAEKPRFLADHMRSPTEDNPGHYVHVLRAIREAAKALPPEAGFDREAVESSAPTSQYVPRDFTSAASAAGVYGFYNIAFMTYHDGRLRDGHPADNIANLNWRRLRQQALEATALLRVLADRQELSLPASFQNNSISEQPVLPRWDGAKATGLSADLMVSGSLAENRPAAGALIAVSPLILPTDCPILGFRRFPLEMVDANGKWKISGVSKNRFVVTAWGMVKLAAMFDSLGGVSAFVNLGSYRNADRIQLFPARNLVLGAPLANRVDPLADLETQVLSAASDALFRDDKSFFRSTDDFISFFIHRYSTEQKVKVFQPGGAVFLGASRKNPYGNGFELDNFLYPPAVDRITAEDLWELNQTRLNLVRSKGVTDVSLEILHNRARYLQDRAEQAANLQEKQSLYAQSAALSRLVYFPVKALMNDLIKAIVILLLLAIPFAFALERLLICSNTVYGRLGGFVVFFLATFTLLYLMHPGFSIAATPIIVFLAFAIIVLTTLVMYIMMRKFRNELMAFQGKVTSMHSAEVSRMGTMIAAVNMGMSTMRRRPTRTLLTCITAVMLTFTILCFASLSSSVGVRSFYEGPSSTDVAATFLLRKLDYGTIRTDFLSLLRGRVGSGEGGAVCGQWWKVKFRVSDDAFDVCRMSSGKSAGVDAIMGISPEELERWDQLAAVFEGDSLGEKKRLLASGGVFLPLVVREQLRLSRGDSLWFNGQRTVFAGVFDAQRLQKIKHLDGRSLLPVDFRDPGYTRATFTSTPSGIVETNASELVQRDFTRLSANQVAITSSEAVRQAGGTLHAVTIYSDPSIDPAVEGKRLAEIAGMPVWTKAKDGIYRLVFTTITQVTGGFALIIPILLGGFIIFGTLLGSITDRQKEIYTFSALGLSPGHVGFLFFAEAGVYAVIGGLGGQLLAQAVALAATQLANLGLIQQPSINFSSTNSIFAILVVMATVLLSSLYPAYRASKSANPGVQRSWKMPPPRDGVLSMKFPFTVSTYDITGVVSFLAEHFREHGDAGLGSFAAQDVRIARDPASKGLLLSALLYLAPFDLAITQKFSLTSTPSELPGIDEISVTAQHLSGSIADWVRSNKVFLRELRRQFLLWRTLAPEVVESYRMETLQALGEKI